MEKVEWKVEGMTCSNCALTIRNYLYKQGMQEVNVNPIDGAVSFSRNEKDIKANLIAGIERLGYTVAGQTKTSLSRSVFSTNKDRFLICLPFTLILMMHMLPVNLQPHYLMNPLFQLFLCLPVFIIGMWFFGRSGFQSLRNGMPNMNVLISLGALASFSYSLTGLVLNLGPQYLFFETTASIITIVFMGNYLEDVSIQSTQRAVKSLAKSQKVMANMIAFDDQHVEHTFPVENTQLKTGDLILIKNGEQVPADSKILWGQCYVDEAIITGESLPVVRTKKEILIGGSIISEGIVKAQVTATGSDTVISGILQMVKKAQGEKPPVQKMADKISAIFVPVVLGIAALTFLINYFGIDQSLSNSIMRAVAVLVIACPCAMGLATPAAIAVGLGRAAKSGILFRNAASLESFKSISQIVFDKTGTLTTGAFSISAYGTNLEDAAFKNIVYSLEKFAAHPIGISIVREWKQNDFIRWRKIEELKGMGIRAEDNLGNIYEAGSYKLVENKGEAVHDVYVLMNAKPIGWIDIKDEIRKEAFDVIEWLHKKNIKTILLSGDKNEKCQAVANTLKIDEVYSEQSPAQKLEKITLLNADQPTAMVGDGINDAPAMAKATLGISLSEASQIALQNADVILMNHGLKNLPASLGLGSHTYLTIKQNLFWAFAYNIVAIPIAATGLLTPAVAALAMGFSDVVLAANSVRLFVKKVL